MYWGMLPPNELLAMGGRRVPAGALSECGRQTATVPGLREGRDGRVSECWVKIDVFGCGMRGQETGPGERAKHDYYSERTKGDAERKTKVRGRY